ncbi:MAG: hypothetical protein HY556_06275 [Euryarchaeota archaeon]|nr:hypothetical protein [Euryarchaeota archaeon]
MSVKSIELVSIEAKRFSRTTERLAQVRIDHNSTVTLVKEVSKSEANIEFRYTASYGSVGVIKLEGSLAYEGDAKALHAKWTESAQMPAEIASEIHTAVMRICVPEAVGIAKNLNLPPPIPLPQVKFQNEEKPKPAAGGPEVA